MLLRSSNHRRDLALGVRRVMPISPHPRLTGRTAWRGIVIHQQAIAFARTGLDAATFSACGFTNEYGS